MKCLALATLVLMLSSAAASAGELAVAESTLDRMGLGGMQQMSDSDGMTVRGKGPFEDRWLAFLSGDPSQPFGTNPSMGGFNLPNAPGGMPGGDTTPPTGQMPTTPRGPTLVTSHFDFTSIFNASLGGGSPFGSGGM